MNNKIFEYLNESDEIEILENTNDSYLVLKTEYSLGLLIEILESEFISSDELLLEIGFKFSEMNIIDYINLNKSEYIIILKL